MPSRVWFGASVLVACSRAPAGTDTTGDDPVEPSLPVSEGDGAEPPSEAPAPRDEPNDDDEPESAEQAPPPLTVSVPEPPSEEGTDSGSGGMDAGPRVDPANDAAPPVEDGSPEAGSDEPVPAPSNEQSPMCVETLGEFSTALEAATRISENYDCTGDADCIEVDPCGGSAFCAIGAFLNVSAGDEFAATRDATCPCYREVPELCPEPEPPSPGCLEGVCTGVSGRAEEAVPPTTCEERTASWERFTAILINETSAYGDCGVIGVGNGCTAGECQYFPVSLPELEALDAMVESHFRFNDCEACGPTLPCDSPPAFGEDDGHCRFIP